MVVMEEKDQKDKRNQTETSEKEFESLSNTDVQLLREAGRICAEQDIEKMFPTDQAWEDFSRKRKRTNRQRILYAMIGAAAVIFIAVIGYRSFISESGISSYNLFTATKEETGCILTSPDGSMEVIVKDELNLLDETYLGKDHYTIETPSGKNLRVILPDSSQVLLNAHSRLSYTQKEERLSTLEGEAYFEVRKDKEHPFVVQAGTAKACVLGTSFNIRHYEPEQIHITLLTGSLAVESEATNNPEIMKPGDDASLLEDGQFIIQEKGETSRPMWTSGYFSFDDAPLSEVLCELGRWYNINVTVLHPEAMTRNLHFRCKRSLELDNILDILNELGGFRLVKKENTIFVQ